jgi:quinol monooxygenase YgiN
MSYLTLLAKVTAKPNCADNLFPELEAMVKPSQAEEGCLKYVLHKSADPNTFWFVEEWKDEAALAEHNKTMHYMRLKQRTKDLVADTELIRLQPVAEAE